MKKLLLLKKIVLIFIFTFLLLNLANSQKTVNITADKDNTISSTYHDRNAGAGSLRAGRTGDRGGNTIHRALLHFNLSSIPAGSKINSATLTLSVTNVGNEPTGLALHKLTENWSEGEATWSHAFFPDFTWTTEGGNFEPTVTASTGDVEIGSLVIPNLTKDVQLWVNDSAGNHGWMLRGADEDKPSSAKLISSREQTDGQPVLSVTYTTTSVKVPTVSLAVPNNILKYSTPAKIKLNATASDEDGTITKVEFYNGSTLLHTKDVYPYDFLWEDVRPGNYRVTAKAFDNSGYVTTSNTIRVSVVDENISGELDSSFGINGMVKTNLGKGTTEYGSTAVQSDGKIVVVGSTTSGSETAFILIRYNTDGSVDSSFSKDEKLTDAIGSIAIQSDGKIVVLGAINEYPYSSILARLNIDGSLDGSFSKDGKQTTDLIISSIAIQSDGKIVVAGSTNNGSNTNFVVARYNTDGSPDRSFSGDGKQYIDLGATSVAIQKDGKIVVAGDPFLDAINIIGLARLNNDGSLDKSFSDDGQQSTYFTGLAIAESIAVGGDGKIVVSGISYDGSGNGGNYFIGRYNPDGSLDSSFSDDGKELTNFGGVLGGSVAIESEGKIILSTSSAFSTIARIARYNTDGSLDSSFSDDGVIRTAGFNARDIVIDSNKLYAVGSAPYGLGDSTNGAVARYLLTGKQNNPPTVSLSIPYNIVKYSAFARIKLNAKATDEDGKITKVQFFNGTTRLHTETESPYGFLWIDVPVGNYTLTAKAFDNSGNVTTSNSINVAVVDENVAPVVSIVSPVDDTTYTGPATIRLIAKAKDPNDKIGKVEFYNGTTIIRTEYYYPYTYTWTDVQPGTYTITAKAYDDKGLLTTSAPVTVTVNASSLPIVKSRPSVNNQTDVNGVLSMKLSPVPAGNTLQISTYGLRLNKPSTILIMSASGVVLKTIQSNASNKVVQVDVSSLASGVYTIKVVSGNKVMNKQFVKL